MKNSILICLSGAALLALVAACQRGMEEDNFVRESRQDITPVGRNAGQIVITASLEQDDESKTALTANRKVVWKAGDQIRVYNASLPAGTVYTLEDASAGSVKGRFTGSSFSGGGPYYAVYPASAGGRLSGTTIAVTLPDSQDWEADSFGEGACLAVASAPSLSSLDFKNVLGAVSFTLSSAKSLQRITVQSKADEALSGSGTVSLDGDEPSLSLNASGSRSLTLNCDGTKASSYYLMLPPGVFRQGFTILIEDNAGDLMFKDAKASQANVVERSKVLAMPAFAYSAQYRGAFLNQTNFGYYTGVGASGTMKGQYTFSQSKGQYATRTQSGKSRYARIQNWDESYAVSATTPYTLSAGSEYNVTLDLMQESGYTQSQGKFLVLKTTDTAAWLVAKDNSGIGFIQPLED